MEIFNEDKLQSELVRIWGEHGAHTLVYDDLMQTLRLLQAAADCPVTPPEPEYLCNCRPSCDCL